MTKASVPAGYQELAKQLTSVLAPKLVDRVRELSAILENMELLKDVSSGLYEEVDKLCKKAPAESVTDLVLSQANTVIKETKQLAGSDPFLSRLDEFVAAGDNPEQRDVVVVLKQLLLGQDRAIQAARSALEKNRGKLSDARGVQCAIALRLQDVEPFKINKDLLAYNGESVSPFWYTGNAYDWTFNFQRLQGIDLKQHFLPT